MVAGGGKGKMGKGRGEGGRGGVIWLEAKRAGEIEEWLHWRYTVL
jgi:hypothetical protein